MTFAVVHISDPHFGAEADLSLIHAVEDLVPDLDPRAIVVSGDLTQRARHGEFQAARAFVRELERSAPVMVIPGNHDVQWWWRPYLPIGGGAKYVKYGTYFGPNLAPTLRFPEAVIASVLTSHGLAWGSLTPRPRDMAVKGHLAGAEIRRAARVLRETDPATVRILVVHHNVLRGAISGRTGLARWRQAERRIAGAGADVLLYGHDHQEVATTLLGGTVVSGAGTLSMRSRGGRPAVFNRVVVEDDAIHVEFHSWDLDRQLFRRTEVNTFPRMVRARNRPAATAPVR